MYNSDTQEPKEVVIMVTLKEYLTQLEAIEMKKPPSQRRVVPTFTDLAKVATVSRATLYNLAANKFRSARLDVLSAVMSELRQCGFPTQVSDLLTAYPAESVVSTKKKHPLGAF